MSIPVIPITYIGNLIGKEGTYLKALCSKYNVESVHLGENSPAEAVDQGKRRREIYIHSGPIKVTYKFKEGDSDKAMRFRKALEERAQEVEKKRQRQYEIVREITSVIIQWYLRIKDKLVLVIFSFGREMILSLNFEG